MEIVAIKIPNIDGTLYTSYLISYYIEVYQLYINDFELKNGIM